MNRRELLAGVGTVGLVGAALVGTVRRAGQSAATYHNPVYDRVFPDPDVCRVGESYYAYGTYHQWGPDGIERQLIPVLRSPNLVDWESVGPAFETEPAWSRYRGLWAPGVGRHDGRSRLYYADSEFGADNPGIGVATASDPAGPFEPRGGLFRSEAVGVPNAIDPMLFEGETPTLFWGSHRGIYGVRLADDGLSTAGETFQIAGEGVEAPYVVERDGQFYFFGSRGTCCAGAESTYHVVVGRAEELRGPYRNRAGDRLTADGATGTTVLQGDQAFPGPGHCAVVRDAAGGWWLHYHAYVGGRAWVGATPRRVLMLDRIRWREGWPVVGADGTPSCVGRAPPVEG
ncbi:family 43 glycosylhydrolase [Haloarcula rara]|uniref:family 43 glycosylhydrolase n=1 Tax=Haloarcula rara TaxID=3033387 RepID=UPI0023E8839D|nr:family 43 glycosylhydrolase [Halomicroarcula sp. SHR3]